MDNPYRVIENVHHWRFIQDATSHWVKGNINKVPFNFNQVPGTGEVLAEEIMENISSVKKVKNNAADSIADALKSSSPTEIS